MAADTAQFVERPRQSDKASVRRRRRTALHGPIPPLDVLWSYRRRPATELNTVKAARAAIVWRGADRRDGASILFRYLRWIRFPALVIKALARDGATTRQLFGRSLIGQISDMTRVAIANGVKPTDYYFAGLASHRGGGEIFRYVPPALASTLMRGLSRDANTAMVDSVKNKAVFEARCRAAGLRVAHTVAIASETAIRTPSGQDLVGPFAGRDLIVKPTTGGRGRGVAWWQCDGPNRFRDAGGAILSSEGLMAHARSLAAQNGCATLIQERVENHPGLRSIAGAALATTRFVTMFNEAGEPEIVDSFYRTSTLTMAAVDNLHAGGTLFPIDIATGALRAGIVDVAYEAKPITHHPQTGALMVGRVHPGWQEMSALALRLHRLFPSLLMPGWDIGFDRDGPIAIEGNITPGFSINRQPTIGGMVGTRAFALLAYHCGRWLEQNEPDTSRWRTQAASATSRSPS